MKKVCKWRCTWISCNFFLFNHAPNHSVMETVVLLFIATCKPALICPAKVEEFQELCLILNPFLQDFSVCGMHWKAEPQRISWLQFSCCDLIDSGLYTFYWQYDNDMMINHRNVLVDWLFQCLLNVQEEVTQVRARVLERRGKVRLGLTTHDQQWFNL